MNFERQIFELYFSRKKQDNLKNNCVPTLPKIFRPVTQNTLIFFLFGLSY